MTHITEEAPRCLIEAMIKATPILGYESAYVKDLFGGKEVGQLCAIGDWKALGEALVSLSNNRELLPPMIEQSASRGREFTDTKIFEDRANLVKEYLA